MSTNRKTRNIALTPEQDAFVETLVGSGQYQSASEVVRDALRALGRDIQRHQAELEDTRFRLRESVAAEARGEFVEGEPAEIIGAVFDEVLDEPEP
jgi:antitoxin ParD1/3/4